MAEEPRDDSQERTEAATPKRKKEAQEKGQIARSRELNTAAVLTVSSAAVLFLGADSLHGNRQHHARELWLGGHADAKCRFARCAYGGLVEISKGHRAIVVGGRGGCAAFALSARRLELQPGGSRFSLGEAGPRQRDEASVLTSRAAGAGQSLGEVRARNGSYGRVVVGLRAGHSSDRLHTLAPALEHTAHIVSVTFILLCGATLLIAAVDVPFQLWDHLRKLRMTRQEAKDELKHTEGKPEVKGRIRAMQRELAQRRMMEAVPSADVVIVNPTHYAVALSYEAPTR